MYVRYIPQLNSINGDHAGIEHGNLPAWSCPRHARSRVRKATFQPAEGSSCEISSCSQLPHELAVQAGLHVGSRSFIPHLAMCNILQAASSADCLPLARNRGRIVARSRHPRELLSCASISHQQHPGKKPTVVHFPRLLQKIKKDVTQFGKRILI